MPESHEQRKSTLNLFWKKLSRTGPLGTAMAVIEHIEEAAGTVPGAKRLCSIARGNLVNLQQYLDRHFDRSYGTDTSGKIALKDLLIQSTNVISGIWYEPMSAKIFSQFMANLNIDFADFDFVDMGSGKGRVLLLASSYGFRNVIGVEFAEELHTIARKNVESYEHTTGKSTTIQTFCLDAVQFPIPVGPVVIFFYSPFMDKVLEQVLENIQNSFTAHPRKVILLFYGENQKSIQLFKATSFPYRELDLRADWSRLRQYRGFMFRSPFGQEDQERAGLDLEARRDVPIPTTTLNR